MVKGFSSENDTSIAGPFAGETVALSSSFTDNIARVGLNYKFD